jgi:hypothetical protein
VRWLLALVLSLASLAFATSARAQPAPDKIAEAKRLFRAGARAYDAGQFEAAALAFEQAYELEPRPPLRFSAAQALKRQYVGDKKPELLHKAQRYYQEYIAAVKVGARVKDATEALGEIDILLAKPASPAIAPPEPGEPPVVVVPQPAEAKKTGTLQLDASVAGATAYIRGRPPVTDLPQWLELEPGHYRVTVKAKGFISVTRSVRVEAGRLTLVDPPLRERPARLTIVADDGSEIVVDGRPVGRAPLPAPLELPSGRHRVTIGKDGYDVFSKSLELKRGERVTIDADPPMTTQRVFAWVVLGGAAVTLSSAIGLAFAAAGAQRAATDVHDRSVNENRALTPEEADLYNGDVKARDNLLRVSGTAFGVGGLAAAVGLMVFVFDSPNLYGAASEDEVEARLVPAWGGGTFVVEGSF